MLIITDNYKYRIYILKNYITLMRNMLILEINRSSINEVLLFLNIYYLFI